MNKKHLHKNTDMKKVICIVILRQIDLQSHPKHTDSDVLILGNNT